ncbi:MAG: glycerophosphodiester phosphodiesterase family protein [Hyphomonadaceae bacterium]
MRAPWLLDYAYAHRGLWRANGAPENSVAAFEAARRAGLGIELDVRLSADGEAIVFHDLMLDRMTKAKGRTNSRTAGELSRLRLLGGDETIPMLGDVLDLFADTPLLIELKVNAGSEGPLERRVASLLANHEGPVCVMSFNATTLRELQHFAPNVARGHLCEGWRRGKQPLLPWTRRKAVRDFVSDQRGAADFLACEIGALAAFGRPAADALHAPLIGWTVRTRAQLERAERLADALIFEGLEPALVKPASAAMIG